MAYYKIGNHILSEEEYDAQNLAVWRFVLFVVGTVTVGMFLHGIMPEDFSKMGRFTVFVLLGGVVGTMLAYSAAFIRAALRISLLVCFLTITVYVIWLLS